MTEEKTKEIKPIFPATGAEHYVAFWAVYGDGTRDWLAALFKVGEEYHMKYRFRYYEDDNLGPDSKDRKSVSEMTSKPGATIEDLKKSLDDCAALLVIGGFGPDMARVDVDSSDPAVIMEKMGEMPHANKTVIQISGGEK